MSFEDFAYNQKPFYLGLEFDANELLHHRKQFPPTNVWEAKNYYLIQMLVPGIEMEHLEINLVENHLEVKGTLLSKKGKYDLQERISGHFRRVIEVNHCINHLEIKAQVEDGILTIKLPKEKNEKQSINPILVKDNEENHG